jgi:hypothetical protein
MSNLSVDLLAWAKVHDTTKIQYTVCTGHIVELTLGGSEGLTLDISERGLLNLLAALAGALQEMYGPASAA